MIKLLMLSALICASMVFAEPDATSSADTTISHADSLKAPVTETAATASEAKVASTPPSAPLEESNPGESNPQGYDEVFATSSERAITSGRPDVISTEIMASESLGFVSDEIITNYQGGTRRVHLENTVFRREDPVTYDPSGRRDPFRALVVDEKKEGEIETDLFRTEKSILTGVIWTEGEFIAMVRDAEGNNFLLHEGDPVFNGRCTAITKSQAIFDIVEFGDYQQLVLKIASPEKPAKITG